MERRLYVDVPTEASDARNSYKGQVKMDGGVYQGQTTLQVSKSWKNCPGRSTKDAKTSYKAGKLCVHKDPSAPEVCIIGTEATLDRWVHKVQATLNDYIENR